MKTILNWIKCHARLLISIVVGLLITIFSNQVLIVDVLVWSSIASINAIISLIQYNLDTIEGVIVFIIFAFCMAITVSTGLICISKFSGTTEYYVPTQVIRSYDRITLIGKTKTLESSNLIIYNNKNPLICKDNQYNAFGEKMSDSWYVCIK